MTEERTNEGTQDPNENLEEESTSENDEEVNFEDEDLSLLEDETKKKFQTVLQQKKYHREKRLKAEAEVGELKKKLSLYEAEKKKEDRSKKADFSEFEDKIMRLELRQKYPHLKDEDIEKAKNFAKVEGKTPSEIIESNFFQSFLKVKAEEERQKKSVPSPSQRSGQPGGVNLEDLSDPAKVREMTDEEFEKASEEAGRMSRHKRLVVQSF